MLNKQEPLFLPISENSTPFFRIKFENVLSVCLPAHIMEHPAHINSHMRYRNTMGVGFLAFFLFLLTSWHLNTTFWKIWITGVNESTVRLLYYYMLCLSLRKCKQYNSRNIFHKDAAKY